MTEAEYAQKLDDLDRLLNDPEVPLDASRVWSLLFDIARHAAEFAGPVRFPTNEEVLETQSLGPSERRSLI